MNDLVPSSPKKSWFASHMILGYFFIFAVLAAAVSVMYYRQTIRSVPTYYEPIVHKDPTANWKTYTNNEQYGFEFKYPPNLQLSTLNNKVVLDHSINYENHGDCDMIGGTKTYKDLQDFKVSFELSDSKPVLPYTDGLYKKGILTGTYAFEGAEGCGDIIYYFPFKKGTIIVKRASIQAFMGFGNWNSGEILKTPGVINKEENDKLFDQILSTFEFVESRTPSHNQVIDAVSMKVGETSALLVDNLKLKLISVNDSRCPADTGIECV